MPTRALLSIRPQFAQAIFTGAKRYEFRRLTFKRPVDVVVVYVTSPVCEVWGEFEVGDIISDHPVALWERTQDAAGIDRSAFLAYFAGKSEGYAIEIRKAQRYELPLHILRDFGLQPPQSFAYLDRES